MRNGQILDVFQKVKSTGFADGFDRGYKRRGKNDSKVLKQRKWKDRVTINQPGETGRTYLWEIRKSVLDRLYWSCVLNVTLVSRVDVGVWIQLKERSESEIQIWESSTCG